jgi:hypothetical protein
MRNINKIVDLLTAPIRWLKTPEKPDESALVAGVNLLL